MNLALALIKLKNNSQAVESLEKGLRYVKEEDKNMLQSKLRCYSLLGSIHFDLSKYTEALFYFEKCIPEKSNMVEQVLFVSFSSSSWPD